MSMTEEQRAWAELNRGRPIHEVLAEIAVRLLRLEELVAEVVAEVIEQDHQGRS